MSSDRGPNADKDPTMKINNTGLVIIPELGRGGSIPLATRHAFDAIESIIHILKLPNDLPSRHLQTR
jgi:hypothetical protein